MKLGFTPAKGSLTVVGTGIKAGRHLTMEARHEIQAAHKVLYIVADPIIEATICSLNDSSTSLSALYSNGKPRIETYNEIVSVIMQELRTGIRLCVALYGHPCVFVYPSREAIKQARSEGFEATMQPGISAEDCLFADMNIDPAAVGCQSFEATDFLIFNRLFDPRSTLILWQIGVIGDMSFDPQLERASQGLAVLTEYLLSTYPPDHQVVVYEASQNVVCEPVINKICLRDLPRAKVTGISTLYIPPKHRSEPNAEMLIKLGLKRQGSVLANITD